MVFSRSRSYTASERELGGGESGDFFEQAAEVVGVTEPKKVSHFTDPQAFHQKVFCLSNDKIVDISDGGATGLLVDNVTEIMG